MASIEPNRAAAAGESPVLACVDGSELSTRAVAAGLALLAADQPVVVVTVIEPSDPSLVTGGGFAGGVMSPEEFDELDAAYLGDAGDNVQRAAAALGLAGSEVRVLRGDPGRALCALAEQLPARALVMGSRGRGGLKRALLGSVSDYVVRNSPCPVVITGAPE